MPECSQSLVAAKPTGDVSSSFGSVEGPAVAGATQPVFLTVFLLEPLALALACFGLLLVGPAEVAEEVAEAQFLGGPACARRKDTFQVRPSLLSHEMQILTEPMQTVQPSKMALSVPAGTVCDLFSTSLDSSASRLSSLFITSGIWEKPSENLSRKVSLHAAPAKACFSSAA